MKNKYQYIVYNCGYQPGFRKVGPKTGKKYIFRKKFVTEVDVRDGEAFCKLTSNDIQWCTTCDKSIPPFMTAEDWCNCKKGTYTKTGGHKYNVEDYVKEFNTKRLQEDIPFRKKIAKIFSCCRE